eukprot:g420.t1
MGCICSSSKVQDVGNFSNGLFRINRTKESVEECANVLIHSFAGTVECEPELGFDWCFGDLKKIEKENDTFGLEDIERRHAALGWTFKFVVESCFASPNGVVVGLRDENNTLIGVAALKVFRTGNTSEGCCPSCKAVLKVGDPKGDAKKYLTTDRMAAFDACLARLHKHIKEPHVYVWMIGVEPGAQKKGIGTKMMEAINEFADRENLICYLESCGDKNKKFYEKLGFQVEHEDKLVTKKNETLEIPYLAMVRRKK